MNKNNKQKKIFKLDQKVKLYLFIYNIQQK